MLKYRKVRFSPNEVEEFTPMQRLIMSAFSTSRDLPGWKTSLRIGNWNLGNMGELVAAKMEGGTLHENACKEGSDFIRVNGELVEVKTGTLKGYQTTRRRVSKATGKVTCSPRISKKAIFSNFKNKIGSHLILVIDDLIDNKVWLVHYESGSWEHMVAGKRSIEFYGGADAHWRSRAIDITPHPFEAPMDYASVRNIILMSKNRTAAIKTLNSLFGGFSAKIVEDIMQEGGIKFCPKIKQWVGGNVALSAISNSPLEEFLE